MYQLSEVSFERTEEREIDIDDQTGEKILSCINYLGTNMRSFYYYQIVKRNLNQLVGFMDDKQNEWIDVDLIECNRLMFNYIDTLYAYINFFESNYKDQFSIIKRQIYDTYFEYRMAYNLRNYIIHEGLGIVSYIRQMYSNKTLYQFCIDAEVIASSSRVKRQFKEEIKQLYGDNKIDLYPILQKQHEILKNIQEKMLDALSKNIISNFDFLATNTINNNETLIKKDGKILNSLLNVTSKFYKSLADNFVYDENYMDTPNCIRDLFVILSRSYYKKPNVICISPKYKKTP